MKTNLTVYFVFLFLALACNLGLSHAQDEEIPEEVPVCQTEDGYIPHENCTKYYQCVNFVPFERSCAGEGSLYWNPRIDECDFQFNVPECVGGTRPPDPTPTTQITTTTTTIRTTTTTMTTTTTTTPAPPTCDPDRHYYVPAESDPTCRHYFLCYFGVPLPLHCPDGLLFDPEEEKCVRAENYECPAQSNGTTTMTEATVEPTTGIENDFQCPLDDFIYMPHHESCNLFYLCINGEFGGISSCGEGHWFDSVFQGCVRPQESDCKLQSLILR